MHRRSDYRFDLPPGQIAQVPADRRDASRLLVLPAGSDDPEDRMFAELVDRLPVNSVLVLNDTRVIAARLRARKATGGAVELVLVEPVDDADSERAGDRRWRCIARASKPIRAGAVLEILDGDDTIAEARVVTGRDHHGHVEVELSEPGLALCERAGEVPLPPYIERQSGSTAEDRQRYQTVYAREPGAVAAPTAGLHFTEPLLEAVRARGCEIATLTLHVGPGTFAPVRVEDVREHRLHVERFSIPERTAALVGSGRPVVAVGTTCVRALEAAAAASEDGQVGAGPGRTDLFIRPGYRFRVVDHLITNFHLPESTLLMLVCAFAGYQRVMAAYRHAVAAGYRFFSYGDACLLSREDRA